MKLNSFAEIAKASRLKVLELIYKAGTSHIGSNFSAADIFAVLFEKIDIKNDKFILSKGWVAASLYYFLWRKGVISEIELNSYCQDGSPFIGLSEPMGRWGLEFGGGSMGMGLPAAVGYALSKKLKGEEGKVYVLESDGGVQTGTFWESVMLASQHNLDNLFLIIDENGFQAMGKTEDILDIHKGWPLQNKLSDFGWESFDTNGHDYELLENGFKLEQTRPMCMIARTIKGKGVSFMEGENLYHYAKLTEEDYKNSLQELENK